MYVSNGTTLICLAAIFVATNCNAADSTQTRLKRNIAFVTFGGKENFGSINFEHIFSSGEKLNWSYSLGVQPFQPSKKLSVPVSVNAFTNGSTHHFEVDLTATFFMDKYHPYNGGWKDDFNKRMYLSPFVCYRFQRRSGAVFKAGVGPQLLLDPPSDGFAEFKTEALRPSVFGAVGISF